MNITTAVDVEKAARRISTNLGRHAEIERRITALQKELAQVEANVRRDHAAIEAADYELDYYPVRLTRIVRRTH